MLFHLYIYITLYRMYISGNFFKAKSRFPYLINSHTLHSQDEIVDWLSTQIGRMMFGAIVLEDGSAVQSVSVSGPHSPRTSRSLTGAGLRCPHHAPCARAGHVIVHATNEKALSGGILQTTSCAVQFYTFLLLYLPHE